LLVIRTDYSWVLDWLGTHLRAGKDLNRRYRSQIFDRYWRFFQSSTHNTMFNIIFRR